MLLLLPIVQKLSDKPKCAVAHGSNEDPTHKTDHVPAKRTIFSDQKSVGREDYWANEHDANNPEEKQFTWHAMHLSPNRPPGKEMIGPQRTATPSPHGHFTPCLPTITHDQ